MAARACAPFRSYRPVCRGAFSQICDSGGTRPRSRAHPTTLASELRFAPGNPRPSPLPPPPKRTARLLRPSYCPSPAPRAHAAPITQTRPRWGRFSHVSGPAFLRPSLRVCCTPCTPAPAPWQQWHSSLVRAKRPRAKPPHTRRIHSNRPRRPRHPRSPAHPRRRPPRPHPPRRTHPLLPRHRRHHLRPPFRPHLRPPPLPSTSALPSPPPASRRAPRAREAPALSSRPVRRSSSPPPKRPASTRA